jgi:uncharacterized protein
MLQLYQIKSNMLEQKVFGGELKFASDDPESGRVEGYASKFGILDRGGDIVIAGAFKDSLAIYRKAGDPIPMLWQHDPSQPIGVWDKFDEDSIGLKVEGELFMDIPQAKGIHTMMRRKAVKGLSIGYRTKRHEIDRMTGARKLLEVELGEISAVTFPMLPEATLTSVKGDSEINPRELEQALREAGLSRADAVKAVAVFRTKSARDASVQTDPPHRDDGLGDLLMAIRAANAAMAST